MLEKAYNPKDFEDRIYDFWIEKDLFSPVAANDKKPFVIVIPPPNVTGVLHLGHGLNNILQDILIRYHRMLGNPTLWLPGTDHAGIATQNVVEKTLKGRGTSRGEIGREAFLEETWKVKEEHHAVIVKQLQKIGASCDWSRERFTLDEGLSKAVREVFVNLYEKGLIYRGNYLINWCSSCGTAIADDEVEHQEVHGKLYHYRYPLSDGSGNIEIATTRPETMLGDSAVAVHPEDPRYSDIIGKMVKLPLTDREIPVIADRYVDMEFGTGAVKITPAHDPNDWEMGNRHNLEKINILNPDGTIGGSAPEKYRGLAVEEARKIIVEDLQTLGLFIREEEHNHQVGHCYRCNTVVEPYLSDQWFVAMKTLAEKAMGAWKREEIRFYPKKWENTYTHWLKGIRDWCISRQLWWGHRIPVWYCDECGEVIISKDDPSECLKCGSTSLRQEEDVLDTWFSSWLWPFSTLGWPEKTDDLEKFFPTSTLVTGYDIIFFWVARMIMAGMEFLGEVPFRDIVITGLVRDKLGRKMSKSLGNGIDPLDVVDVYGADAMKFTLAFLAAQGQDILIDMDTFKMGSRFANKIWNATRYLLMNLPGRTLLPVGEMKLKDLDRWIFHRLNETVKVVYKAMASYRFNDATSAIYEFFWNDFCDWYVEASKISLYSDDDEEKDRIVSLLLAVLEESMRLMHPFLSFLTEEIYQKLPEHGEAIINASYPVEMKERENREIVDQFTLLQDMIRSVRTLRSEFIIPPDKKIRVWVKVEKDFTSAGFFSRHKDVAALLINTSEITISREHPDSAGAIPVAGNGFEAFVYVKDVIDIEKAIVKLQKEKGKLEKLIQGTEKKLQNRKFLENAPGEVIDKEKSKLKEFKERIEKITRYLNNLGG
jgi:valyl-tRNA synthetase